MEWEEIMKISDPREAMKQIDLKVGAEMISLEEMEEMVRTYARLHHVTVDEMAFYDDGERVIGNGSLNI